MRAPPGVPAGGALPAPFPGGLPPLLVAVRRRWRLRTLAVGAGRALLAGAGVAALLAGADAVLDLSAAARSALRWLPALAAAFPLAWAARRAAVDATPERVGLLVDERGGGGALASTLLRPNVGGPVAEAFRARATARLATLSPARLVPVADRAAGLPALAGALVALVLALGVGNALADRWLDLADPPLPAPGSRDGARTGAPAAPPGLGALRWTVTPPAYAGLRPAEGREGEPLAALPGSVVELGGDGEVAAPSLRAAVVGGADPVTRAGEDGWAARWTVTPSDRGVRLEAMDGDRVVDRRVVPLRVLTDRPPRVELTAPAGDVVLASPAGTLALAARADDDHGVAGLTLHWVRSRGSGESFDFQEGTWAWDALRRDGTALEGTLALALPPLALEPGDVVHVRAVATDGNDVTGPGRGVSATRRLRIAGEDEMGEVTTLIGFPIEREREPVLSQRMIILLTEELRDAAPGLTREALVDSAGRVADEQRRLRTRMGEQIFARATGAMQDPEAHLDFEEGEGGEAGEAFLDALEGQVRRGPLIDPETGIASISNVDIVAHEHDSDPVIAINRTLLTVYNLMWDAERALRQAALDASLVPQNEALDALQRLREGERVFARGRVTVPPVDVAATRGTGEMDGVDPAPREARAAAGGGAREVAARLDALLRGGRVPGGRGGALLLSELALELLPLPGTLEASEALGRAATRAGEGDAEGALALVRRARGALLDGGARAGAATPLPRSLPGARFAASAPSPPGEPGGAPGAPGPFVFATARYASGDWDSAPLVPANLIHSLARYTDVPVAPEGVVVELSSPRILDYPFLFLTGHLPVFFDEDESRNLVAFVERGGLLFVDDHNHDIDGAFHRSVTSELERLFGPGALEPIPADHPLYRAFFVFEDGPPVTSHELSGWGDGLIHRELLQVEVGGRIGVLYSNKDYASEWSYHAENKRFLAVDNTRFGVNLLLYALTR